MIALEDSKKPKRAGLRSFARDTAKVGIRTETGSYLGKGRLAENVANDATITTEKFTVDEQGEARIRQVMEPRQIRSSERGVELAA